MKQATDWHSKDEATWVWELNALANPQMAAARSKGSVEDWATESLTDAKLAYSLLATEQLIRSGKKLGDDYCRLALPIIQLRLAQCLCGLDPEWDPEVIFTSAVSA